MSCEDDSGMCGICYEDWKREVELEKRCDYRLEMEFDNKPIYSNSIEEGHDD